MLRDLFIRRHIHEHYSHRLRAVGLPHHVVSGSHRPPRHPVWPRGIAPHAGVSHHAAERPADAAGVRGAVHGAGRGAGERGDGHHLHRLPEPAEPAGTVGIAGTEEPHGGLMHEGSGDGDRRSAQSDRGGAAAPIQHRGRVAGAGPRAGVLPRHPQLHGHRQRKRGREAPSGAGVFQRPHPLLLRRGYDRQ